MSDDSNPSSVIMSLIKYYVTALSQKFSHDAYVISNVQSVMYAWLDLQLGLKDKNKDITIIQVIMTLCNSLSTNDVNSMTHGRMDCDRY